MLKNSLTIPVINYHLVHRLSQCPCVLMLQESFSFRHFGLQEYLRQQENNFLWKNGLWHKYNKHKCHTIVCRMIHGATAISKSVRDSHFFTKHSVTLAQSVQMPEYY